MKYNKANSLGCQKARSFLAMFFFAVGDSRRYVYMSMEEVLAKLNDYVLLLSEAQEKDNYANNRPISTKRLAAAAEMYALLHKNNEVTAIDALVQQEIRAHGWSFIEGPYGGKIASAWVAFTKATGIDQ